MIRGMYTAASGMVSAMRRMEQVTNNIANAQTIGFKQDRSALSTFDEMMILQDGRPHSIQQDPQLGQLGMGTVAEESMIDFTQGSLQQTDRKLDFALEGPGFFALQTPDGLRYTRDGGFTLDATGRLMNTEGHLVLGTDGNPIQLPPGDMQVDPDGTVKVENQPVGQFQIVEFTLDQPLKKVGNNQFVARNPGDEPRPSGSTAVHQGAVEGSNLDMAGAQTTMLELQRAYQASQKLIQYQDEMVGRAVNEIARPTSWGRRTMWTSLRTAVTGLMGQQRALDVASDNLTKLQSPGAKSQRVSFLELAPELQYLGVPDGEGNVQLEAREVGKGVRAPATLRDLSQGALQATGNVLDVAVQGDGYLEVMAPGGEIAYTHSGSLQVDGIGRLSTNGGLVISPTINVPQGTTALEVKPDGTVRGNAPDGSPLELGKLKLVRFVNPEGLQLKGENLLVPSLASGAPIESVAGQPGVGTIASGVIEMSNVDTREEYLRIVQAQRAYQLNVRALKTVDEMLQDANNLRRS